MSNEGPLRAARIELHFIGTIGIEAGRRFLETLRRDVEALERWKSGVDLTASRFTEGCGIVTTVPPEVRVTLDLAGVPVSGPGEESR